ncbi:MAG: allophanate hydrolase subunit 1 [Hyphomicrobiaceae bacterium]
MTAGGEVAGAAAGDAPLSSPMIRDAGEMALVVEFGDTVDPAIHDLVLMLEAALADAEIAGVRELVPTFRSLMIHYDPLAVPRDALARAAIGLSGAVASTRPAGRTWTLPCCYEAGHGEDLAAIAEDCRHRRGRGGALHLGAVYRIYMYGFAPGHCYLGGLAAALAISRRATPRPPHQPGAVMIGGGMALVTTMAMPTGWWVIGRTPERMFSIARTPETFAAVGDRLRFEAVGRDEFDRLEARAATGEIVARREPAR